MKAAIILIALSVYINTGCRDIIQKVNGDVQIPDNLNSAAANAVAAEEKMPPGKEQRELPVNWPWRGVSVESKKTRPADIPYLRSVHVNLIRIFIKGDKRAKREGSAPMAAFYSELAWADSILDAAKKEGITCMLAFNNLVLDPNSGINDKSPQFWSDQQMLDSAFRMVDIIALRYKNRGQELTAYEVIGEPAVNVEGKSRVPDKIESFYSTVLKTIRKHDQTRFFLLTPGPWAKPVNYRDFKAYAIRDKKLIYGAHMYMPDEFTHQGVKKRPRGYEYPGRIGLTYWNKETLKSKFEALRAFERSTGHLIFIGEFQSVRWAKGSNIWLKDVIDIFEANKWSWAMYGFQCDTDFWDPYYDVIDTGADYTEWKIEYKGKNTDGWKLLTDYFRKNVRE